MKSSLLIALRIAIILGKVKGGVDVIFLKHLKSYNPAKEDLDYQCGPRR